MKEFIFTVDVERLCFETHSFDNKVVKRIEDIAIPKLLTIFSKNNIKATFFYTAEYVKLSKGLKFAWIQLKMFRYIKIRINLLIKYFQYPTKYKKNSET